MVAIVRAKIFIERLAESMGVSKIKAHIAYYSFIAVALDALSRGEEVRLEGLGRFTSHATKKTSLRNPDLPAVTVEVDFHQFKDSKTKLAQQCPFGEEIFDALPQHKKETTPS